MNNKVNKKSNSDIYVKNRRFLIPSELKNIAIQNDHNSDILKISIPRYYDEKDLSKHNIILKCESATNNSQYVFTSEDIEVFEDEIILKWKIKGSQTKESGKIKLQISIFSSDFKWQSEIGNVNILESLDTRPMDDNQLDFIEKFMLEIDTKIQFIDGVLQEVQGEIYDIDEKVQQAKTSADLAKQYSDSIGSSLQVAQESAQIALECSEQAQQIKDSTEIFYHVDTTNKRVGFRKANEPSFTYTPTLKGDKGDRGEDGLRGPQGPKGAEGKPGINGADGRDGIDGVDGREIELQRGISHIQWRYNNEELWTNLIAIDELKGETGQNGSSSQSAQLISSGVDIFNLSYGEYYTKDNNVAKQCSNTPPSITNSFNLQVLRSTQSDITKVLMLRSYAPNEIWTNTDNFGSWTGWKKVSFESSEASGDGGSIQKGQKIDFPFLSGFINSDQDNKSFIQKTGDFVTVYIHFKPTSGDGISAAETKIGTLPSGYYCDRDLSFAGTETSGNVVKFKIKKTGEVYSLARFYCKDACCLATYQV